MLFSIIIPAYNVDKYIEKCIESIICQDRNKFEIIVVDDGSTDKTGIVCDEYSNKYSNIKVFHTENKGVSRARNLGLSEAIGDYILFVYADDWVTSDYDVISKEIEGVDLLFFSNSRVIGEKIIKQSYGDAYAENRVETEELILNIKKQKYEYFGFTWNKCFSRNIISKNNILFVNDLSVREDEVFTNTYCSYINSIKFIKKILYNYREQITGLTYKEKSQEEWILMCKSLDESTKGISNVALLSYEKSRIMKYYLRYMKSYDFSKFKIMYDFYKNNSAYIIKSDDLKSITFFRLPILVSYFIFIILHLIRSLIHK